MNRPEKASSVQEVRLERRLPSHWRVTFDHPPLDIFGPRTIPQLGEIITATETDEGVKVVGFDSAVEGFFLTHYDFLAPLELSTRIAPGPTGLQADRGVDGARIPSARRCREPAWLSRRPAWRLTRSTEG